MWKQNWVIGLCIAASVAGMLEKWQKVNAAGSCNQPAPCPQYQCDNITYYWSGAQSYIKAYLNPGGTRTSVYAITDLFTPTSTFRKPTYTKDPATTVDLYHYPSCTPQCGKDSDGVWQVPQEVSPSGTSTVEQPGVVQVLCTSMQDGQIGLVDDPATNGNSNKYSPPGYTSPCP